MERPAVPNEINGVSSDSSASSRSADTVRVRCECPQCRLNTMSVTAVVPGRRQNREAHKGPCRQHRHTKAAPPPAAHRLTLPDISPASRAGRSTSLSQTPPGFIHLGLISAPLQSRVRADGRNFAKVKVCVCAGVGISPAGQALAALLMVISPDARRSGTPRPVCVIASLTDGWFITLPTVRPPHIW